MKRNKKEKGITLIALVITIIILLILVGITINSLIGSRLFENTKLAKEKSENAEKVENETLVEYESEIGKYLVGTRNDMQSTILYPNGSKENPPNISPNQTIEIENPYKGHTVYALVEIQYDGKWGETGFIYSGGGYGVKATRISGTDADKIVIRSGRSAICAGGADSGNGLTGDFDIKSAPYRLTVICLD